MKTLIKNALIIPMRSEGEYFSGDILIKDEKIEKIGKNITDTNADIIDASSYIALPAFINAHTHLAMGLMRNYKDDKENLEAWLSEIFPIEDKLNEEDVLISSRLGIIELIKGGSTTFADMYFFAHETIRAVKEAGINALVGLTFFGDENESRKRISERYPLMKKEKGEYERISFAMAPHAVYTTTKESYRIAKEEAEKENAIVHTHLSETTKAAENCLNERGVGPLFYLESIGALSSNMILAHGVHLTDAELEIVKEKGISVVNNPTSNMKLTSGALDVKHLLKMGINVALGTDGASSNNNLNMLEEMHVAALSASLKAKAPIKPYDVIKMATINGAKALGISKRLGTLEEGKDADIILLSTEGAHMNPLNDPFSAIVYSAQSEDIKAVFSAGKMLLKDRKITYTDEKKIIEDVKSSWSDILRRQ